MMDSVAPASTNAALDLKSPTASDVLEMFATFARANPNALAYIVRSEDEAAIILDALVPTLRAGAAAIPRDGNPENDRYRNDVLKETNAMVRARLRRRAYEFIGRRVGPDAISLSGIRLITHPCDRG